MGSFRRDFGAELVSRGTAHWLPPTDCRQLNGMLSSKLPWSGFHVAWHTLPGSSQFDWGSESDAQASAFVRELALCRYTEVTLLYSSTEGLRVPSSWLADHPDVASCAAQQFFGIGGSVVDPDLRAVAEFEAGSTIWGFLPNPTGLRPGG
jgi:hypothetical protein